MKRPDLKQVAILLTFSLLVALGATGCGGIHASVPISPMMFMQQRPATPPTVTPEGPMLAANEAPAVGR